MTDSKNNIPRWLLIVTFLFALLEFGVSLSLFIAPASVLETVDFNAKGVTELAHMWAVRQLAIAVILSYSAFKKSSPMLTLAYVFFLVMFLGDLFIGIRQQEMPLISSALVMTGVSGFILRFLFKHRGD